MSTAARTRSLRASAGLVAIAALALTACASDESAEFEDGQAEAAGQTEQTAETQATEEDAAAAADEQAEVTDETADSEEGSAETAEASETDEAAAPDLREAEQTVTVPTFEPGMGEVTVEVYPLEVEEDVMRLSLAFTPDLDSGDSIRTDQMFDTVGPGRLMLPTLNDRQNLKEYSILGASGMSDSGWSTGSQEIGDGDTASYWAYYSAPEDDIDSISVAVAAGMPEFDEVSIEWGDATPNTDGGDE